MKCQGFAVVDMGVLPGGKKGRIPLARRFAAQVFTSRELAEEFFDTLPQEIAQHTMIVPVMR